MNWNLHFFDHTFQDRNLEIFHIKEDLKIDKGGGADTNQDPTLYVRIYVRQSR